MPCFKIYEDDNYLSFLDIFPRVPGHALVIPKKHYRWVNDVPAFGEYWEIAKKVAGMIQKKQKSSFISYVTMGNEVPHAHIHILPQSTNNIQGFHLDPVVSMERHAIGELAKALRA